MNKQTYRVRDGVDWINGARAPDSRLVDLTAGEAMYDLAVGRIALDPGKKPDNGKATDE